MKRAFTRLSLKLTAVLLSTVPVIVAVISYFPLWKKEGAVTMLSGFTLLLLLLALVPLIKTVKRLLSSPTATTMWLVLFLLFFALSRIADEMVVISFVGYVGNLSASFLWRLSGRLKREG